jgi:hypothetical protein
MIVVILTLFLLVDLFAFQFVPKFQTSFDGWRIYDAIEDFKRMGIPNSQYRIATINEKFTLSSTYPQYFSVPVTVTDDELIKIASFRSRGERERSTVLGKKRAPFFYSFLFSNICLSKVVCLPLFGNILEITAFYYVVRNR